MKKLQPCYNTHQIDKHDCGKRNWALPLAMTSRCKLFENFHDTEFAQETEKFHAYPDVAHISLFCYESARRCSAWEKVYRNLYQISSEFSQTRKHAILISMQLVFQMVSFVHTVTGQGGMRTVFRTGRTCCGASVAGVTLG